MPDGGHELISADHVLAVSNDMHQKVEHFGFARHQARCAIELATVRIQPVVFEQIEQLATPRLLPGVSPTHPEPRKNEDGPKEQLSARPLNRSSSYPRLPGA